MRDCGCDTLSQYLTAGACEKFSPRLREEWTKHFSTSTKVPNLDDLFNYTKLLEHTLSSLTVSTPVPAPSKSAPSSSAPKPSKASSRQCTLCHENHRLFHCPVFLGYDINQRKKYIQDKRGCINCLSLTHRTNDCSSQMQEV